MRVSPAWPLTPAEEGTPFLQRHEPFIRVTWVMSPWRDNLFPRLVTGGRDGCLKIWSYNSGHCLHTLRHGKWGWATPAMLPVTHWCTTGHWPSETDRAYDVWDISTSPSLYSTSFNVSELAFHGDTITEIKCQPLTYFLNQPKATPSFICYVYSWFKKKIPDSGL